VARLWWDSISNYQSYHVEYRKSGNNWNWFPINTNDAHAKATDLEPDMDYEARVNGITNENVSGPWSNTVTFHTPPLPVINCGDQPVPLSTQTVHPLTMAAPGNIWQIGQFELIVSQLQNMQSSSGIYSGLGKVVLPLGGMNVRCSFTNIMVDEDHRVRNGEVVALSEGVSTWLSQWSSPFDAVIYNYNQPIDSLYVDGDGNIVIVGQNGDTTQIQNQSSGTQHNMVVSDPNGNYWVIEPNGTVTYVPAEFADIIKQALLSLKTESKDSSTIYHDAYLQANSQVTQMQFGNSTSQSGVYKFLMIDETDDEINDLSTINNGSSFKGKIDVRREKELNWVLCETEKTFSTHYIEKGTFPELAICVIVDNIKLLDDLKDWKQQNIPVESMVGKTKSKYKVFLKTIIESIIYK
jgi:hypothetical protein